MDLEELCGSPPIKKKIYEVYFIKDSLFFRIIITAKNHSEEIKPLIMDMANQILVDIE